jgi:hypothetical protein
MSWESDLVAKLVGHDGVSDLVGSRAYWDGDVPASAAMPYLLLQEIAGTEYDGQSGEGTLVSSRVQLTAWAATRAAAKAVLMAVRDAIARATATTWGSTEIVSCRRQGGYVAIPALSQDGSQAHLFGIATDYELHYRQALPAG